MSLYSFQYIGSVVPGAGAFEIAAHSVLVEFKKTVKGKARLGVQVRSAASLSD